MLDNFAPKKLILKKQHQKYYIYTSHIENNRQKLTSTGISLNFKSEFDTVNQQIVYNSKLKNPTYSDEKIKILNEKLNKLITNLTQNNYPEKTKLVTQIIKIQNYYSLNLQHGTAKRCQVLINFLNNSNYDKIYFKELKPGFVEDFYSDCQSKKNTPNTIIAKFKILKTILKKVRKLEKNNNINIDYLFENIQLKMTEPKLRYLSDYEIKTLFENFFNNTLKLSKIEIEAYKMFLFSVNTGLRFRDVILLKNEDVNLHGNLINVINSKTKKNAHIHLNITAKKLISIKNNKLVFNMLKEKDLLLSESQLYQKIENYNVICNRALKKIAKQNAINPNLSFHFARHTCATQLLNKGVDLEIISKILGHANIRQTETYLKVNNNLKINALNKLDEILDEF